MRSTRCTPDGRESESPIPDVGWLKDRSAGYAIQPGNYAFRTG
ncbi:MAG: hypothetical protein ABI592_13400 [Acidobacteriota bacterium]